MAQVPLATSMAVVWQLVLYSGPASNIALNMKTHQFWQLGLNRHNYGKNYDNQIKFGQFQNKMSC